LQYWACDPGAPTVENNVEIRLNTYRNNGKIEKANNRKGLVKLVKVIMGLKGSGKTAQLTEMVRKAVDDEHGDVVCIEKGSRLRYDIPYQVRLIDASQYEFDGYDFLKGFISGLHSANYDITHIFIDSVLRIIGAHVDSKAEDFFDWCSGFSDREGVKFTLTVSEDIALATDRIKKYF